MSVFECVFGGSFVTEAQHIQGSDATRSAGRKFNGPCEFPNWTAKAMSRAVTIQAQHIGVHPTLLWTDLSPCAFFCEHSGNPAITRIVRTTLFWMYDGQVGSNAKGGGGGVSPDALGTRHV